MRLLFCLFISVLALSNGEVLRSINTPIAKSIYASDIHAYEITLRSGDFVKFSVDQEAIALRARVSGPENFHVSFVATSVGGDTLTIEFVAEGEGVYRIAFKR